MDTQIVEVVLPFNRVDEYFVRAIQSVIASKRVHIYLTLVDDRLEDNLPIPEFAFENYRVIRTKIRGYGNALREASELLKYEYFALMNSDDIIDEYRIYNQLKNLELNSSDLCISRIFKFNSSLQILVSKLGVMSNTNYDSRVLLLGAYGADASWCGKSSVLRNFSFSNELSADWIIALNNFGNLNITYANDAFYFYRQHDYQLTKSKSYKNQDFDSIFNAWRHMNSDNGLMDLDLNSAILVCAAWIRPQNITIDSIKNSNLWLNNFNNSTSHIYKHLIYRRKLLLLVESLKLRYFTIELLFQGFIGLSSLILDFFYNLIFSIRFRRLLKPK